MDLSRDEILRVLKWVDGCDGESFITEDDWPLIEKFAAAVDELPEVWAPNHGSDRSRESKAIDRAIYRFQAEHGHWPSVNEQTDIRRSLGYD